MWHVGRLGVRRFFSKVRRSELWVRTQTKRKRIDSGRRKRREFYSSHHPFSLIIVLPGKCVCTPGYICTCQASLHTAWRENIPTFSPPWQNMFSFEGQYLWGKGGWGEGSRNPPPLSLGIGMDLGWERRVPKKVWKGKKNWVDLTVR